MTCLSERSLEIQHMPARDGDILSSVSDVSLAKTNLKFVPKISLRDGLKRFLSEKC